MKSINEYLLGKNKIPKKEELYKIGDVFQRENESPETLYIVLKVIEEDAHTPFDMYISSDLTKVNHITINDLKKEIRVIRHSDVKRIVDHFELAEDIINFFSNF